MPNPLYAAALSSLRKAVDGADRKGNVAFPIEFVKADDPADTPPLARLVQGGRGGEVRLRLYLCLTMMATAKPHNIRRPPTSQTWAKTLALPAATGPRRVTDNMNWLAANKFIEIGPRNGYAPPPITLLSLDDASRPYERASLGSRYVGIPIDFWSRGWILTLSPTATATLFMLLESQGGHSAARYIPSDRRELYGVSHNTWTKARKELEHHGFLSVGRVPQGSDFDYRRLRNTYRIDEDRFSAPPGSPA
ncbi:hypothetical protein [Streptomyces subrutilus]|uniref:hypothetical protein n=1 Tax=Streptomyces subrutilus TaxID=36818 RepID=UPI0033CD55E7